MAVYNQNMVLGHLSVAITIMLVMPLHSVFPRQDLKDPSSIVGDSCANYPIP